MIVFDFDKTLTQKDTIFGFYQNAAKSKRKFKILLPGYYLIAVLTKLGILSNTTLKKAGIRFFLKGYNIDALERIGKAYASSIKLNEIYYSHFLEYNTDEVIIMSASYDIYLKYLFPEYKVVASKIKYNNAGKVEGLDENIFGQQKLNWLLKNNIKIIDTLYTDSFSDKPLMSISKCTYLVKNGGLLKLSQ